MKSGASDPFAEDSQSQSAKTEHETDAEDKEESAESASTAAGRHSGTEQESTERTNQDDKRGPERHQREFSRDELPYILRRDKVKDERPEVHQLFVQEETHSAAIDAERELEDRISDDLSRTDAREAIYRAGMQHLDDAEEILRRWGYDL